MAWFCAATVTVPIAAAQQACPVVDGVVHADRCAPGWSPGDATAALGSAFGSGAHTVIVRKMASPWVLSSTVSLALGNQTVIFHTGTRAAMGRHVPSCAALPLVAATSHCVVRHLGRLVAAQRCGCGRWTT